jgi:hypothetical protein
MVKLNIGFLPKTLPIAFFVARLIFLTEVVVSQPAASV